MASDTEELRDALVKSIKEAMEEAKQDLKQSFASAGVTPQ